MFDLEMHIQQWRSRLLQTDGVSAAEVDELESHLRDSTEELSVSPLTSEESFWLAARRVGSPESIALEFSKVNGARTWTRRAQWMLVGYLMLSVILGFLASMGQAVTMLAVYLQLPLWISFSLSSLSVTLSVVLLILWAWSITEGKTKRMQSLATQFAGIARAGNYLPIFLSIFGLLGLKYGLNFIMTIGAARIMVPQQFGMASIVSSSTGWLGNVLLFGTIIMLLCWLVGTDNRGESGRWNSRKVATTALVLSMIMIGGYGLMSFGVGAIYGRTWVAPY